MLHAEQHHNTFEQILPIYIGRILPIRYIVISANLYRCANTSVELYSQCIVTAWPWIQAKQLVLNLLQPVEIPAILTSLYYHQPFVTCCNTCNFD